MNLNFPLNNLKFLRSLIDKKDYDGIYDHFGKYIYNVVTPKEYKKNDINELLFDEKYWVIYDKYLPRFRNSIKNLDIYREKDIFKLKSEGRFIELDLKYPEYYDIEEVYNSDVYYETGSRIKAKLYSKSFRLKTGIKSFFKSSLLVSSSLVFLLDFSFMYNKLAKVNNIEKLYSEEIVLYNKQVSDYASYVKGLGLNDLQIIMKVIDDIWNDMDGYGEPDYDLDAYYRLALLEPNSSGVCRNIADKFTSIMNEIMPNCDAKNLIVYMDHSKYHDMSYSNVNFKLASDMVVVNDDIVEEESGNDMKDIIGNHMVTVLKLDDCDYHIVVDATNSSIGVIIDGEIYMLSTYEGKGLSYKWLGEYLLDFDYDFNEINGIFIKSLFYEKSDTIINELIDKYGFKAQNEALEYVRSLNYKEYRLK